MTGEYLCKLRVTNEWHYSVDSANPLLIDGDGTAEHDVDTDERARDVQICGLHGCVRRLRAYRIFWMCVQEIFANVDSDDDEDERVLDQIVASQKRRGKQQRGGGELRSLDDAERMDDGYTEDTDAVNEDGHEDGDDVKSGEDEPVAKTSSSDSEDEGDGLWKPLPAESASSAADARSTIDFTKNERGDDTLNRKGVQCT